MRASRMRETRALAAIGAAAALTAGVGACGDDDESASSGGGGGGGGNEEVTIGLITKTESNPFFVKMKEGAHAAAKEHNVKLLTASGKSDTDNASQVTEIENMTTQGAELIGKYAKAKAEEMGIEPKIAMLDLAPGITVGQLRHDGFHKGFGIEEGDPAIVGAAPTQGDTAKGQAAMENLLQKDPGINVIYSINEPSGFGGATALKAAGKDPKDFILVSVDGGCDAIKRGIKTGVIDATSQQYPLKMAALGVEKGAAAARGGEKPSGYVDTGVELITADPVDGVESKDAAYGEENCWG